MNNKSWIFKFVLCGFFYLVTNKAIAIDERYAALPLMGSQIAKDSSNLVQDTVFFNLALRPTQSTFSVKNFITFKVDEFSNIALPDTFKVTITFKVYFSKYVNGNVVLDSSAIQTLYVEYNKFRNYQSKGVYTFTGGYKSQVKILSVTSSSSSGTFDSYRNALLLENEIIVSREYNFDPAINVVQTISGVLGSSTDQDSCSSAGEFMVSWPKVPVTDEYDFEWTYVDSSAISNFYIPNTTTIDPKKIFLNNASRVSITTENYQVPIIYENGGILYYRVRAVRIKLNGQRIEGTWSSNYTNGLGSFGYAGHERDLNWQATTSFAEEGKRKSVVQYFDGTMRNRQTVTKDNNTCYTIVAETMYDFQGRQVIQVMPAPTLSRLIGFTPGFNKDINGADYEKPLYDMEATGGVNNCNALLPGMGTLSGASNYYSPANGLVNSGFNKYIPDAKLFPFTETRYTPDNSGRIAMQSGVGKDFQINKLDVDNHSHETRYFYGSADQEELDALFGTEVGASSHYFKNMVRDANGQYSVSYTDMHGRTVATALAGKPESKLDSLLTSNRKTIVKKLLDTTNNFVFGSSIISSKSLIVTNVGAHRFEYSLLSDSINIKACNNIDICYDCLYDLEITISNDCSNPNDQPIIIRRTNYNPSITDTLCNSLFAFPNVDTSIILSEGSYTITKNLTISQSGFDKYRDIFNRRNLCKSLQEFIDEQQQIFLSQVQCYPSCQSCIDSLGTWDNFRTRYMSNNSILPSDSVTFREQAWVAFKTQQSTCNDLCENTGIHNSIREQMLIDMTAPYGQYAEFDSAYDPHNIFYTMSGIGGLRFKQLPGGVFYKDEYGRPDSIINATGIKVPPTHPTITALEFLENYKLSWAETLLELHPEYCKLLKTESYAASHIWDENFASVSTYQQALDSGFINPSAFTGLPVTPVYTAPVLNSRDPFFTSLETTYAPAFKDSLLKIVKTTVPNISAWALATIMSHCGTEAGNEQCFSNFQSIDSAFKIVGCAGELDFAWRYFRELYLFKKSQIVENIIRNNCSGQNVLSWHTLNFPNIDPLDGSHGIPQNSSSGVDSLNKFIDENCKAYISQWMTEMKPCNLTTADSTLIIPRLIGVCKAGGDVDHIFGSSTTRKGINSNGDTSFIQVLKSLLGSRYDATCNAFLITAPLPYNFQPSYSNIEIWDKPDSCQCDKITSMYQEFLNSISDTSFSAFVFRKTGTSLSNSTLDTLRSLCSGLISCNFLSEPIVLPPALQCYTASKCVTCPEMSNAYNKFKADFPGSIPVANTEDSAQIKTNMLFEKYMNYKFGFSKKSYEYISFLDTCNLNVTVGSGCDSLNKLLDTFRIKHFETPSYQPTYNSDGCDITTWYHDLTSNPYLTSGQLKIKDLFTGGGYGIPNSVYNYLPASPSRADSMAAKRFSLSYYQTICNINNAFTYESKFRVTNPFPGEGGYVFLDFTAKGTDENDSSDYYWFKVYFGHEGSVHIGRQMNNGPYIGMDIVNVPIAEWYTLKIIMANGRLKVFINDIAYGEMYGMVTITEIGKTSVQHFWGSRDIFVDYVYFDVANGEPIFHEDFNLGCSKFGIVNPKYDCNKSPCEQAFVNYFNIKRGTNYTFAQIDSIYLATCGVHPAPCTTLKECSSLDKMVADYQKIYLNPTTGYVDYDLRTFAGNKAPDAGPKGVFDVNQNLIGNTATGTAVQIKQSYAQVWNSSTVNQTVGTLSLLANGKFRLTLNPGKTAPCDGIIGMRYYQFDAPIDTLDAVLVGTGCFIDFGDGNKEKIVSGLDARGTKVFQINKYNSNINDWSALDSGAIYYYSLHYYNDTSTKIVTIYHPDVLAVLGIDNYYVVRPLDISKLKNLRGYMPQQTLQLIFASSQDSSFNTMDNIVNFNEVNSILSVTIQNGSSSTDAYTGDIGVPGYSTAPNSTNFPSFANNPNLISAWFCTGNYPQLPHQLFNELFPDIKNNFKKLQNIGFNNFMGEYTNDIDFSLQNLDHLLIRGGTLTSVQIDSIIIQVARTSKDSGRLIIRNQNGAIRTPASDAAYNILLNKKWYLSGAGMNVVTPVRANVNLPLRDSIPLTNNFTEFYNEQHGTNYSYHGLMAFLNNQYGSVPNFCTPITYTCDTVKGPTLCGSQDPVFQAVTIPSLSPCADSTLISVGTGTLLYQAYQDSILNSFNDRYLEKCLKVRHSETFKVTAPVSEFHYTLYYYDQAGNLVKTIPPAGVDVSKFNWSESWSDSVKLGRSNDQLLTPLHNLSSQYRYNTLNQVVAQTTPDGGLSKFWYDKLGRLAISQNAKQKANSATELNALYSYTKYDYLGRIAEVGQIKNNNASQPVTNVLTRDNISLDNWYTARNTLRGQITKTFYDNKYSGFIGFENSTLWQTNLRNRVSFSSYTDSANLGGYNQATIYSYDIHGNVDTLLQDYGNSSVSGLANVMNVQTTNSNRWKRMVYRYDLISGKVNHVAFQPPRGNTYYPDMYYHRYAYDAENRLTLAETSMDSVVWEKEARYDYYRHGPLARSVLGEQLVQGLDYAYTLQGWLKGLNAITLSDGTNDIGADGKISTANQFIGRDALGFNLNYFATDYSPINATVSPFPVVSTYLPTTSNKPLYNGNISSMAVNIKFPSATAQQVPQLYNYTYDQLNRITEMDVYRGLNETGNTWSAISVVNDYKERIAYDGNGNILKYLRNGAITPNINMDSLTYNYYPNTNKLKYVKDNVTDTNYAEDIDNQTNTGNYSYDQIGNMVSDAKESITLVKWNVYGKITEIQRTATTANPVTNIQYTYDAAGNRISKRVVKNGTNVKEHTWYVRDAQGNVIATYNSTGTNTNFSTYSLNLTEQHLYSSNRLGILNRNLSVKTAFTKPSIINFIRGNKLFELSNHLGNVLVTVSDKKIPVPKPNPNQAQIDYYTADVVTANDYAPGGMQMPGRNYSAASSKYRYGFNGKEKSNEIYGEGNAYDFGARIMDPRLGRWFSIDPHQAEYAGETPYNFSGNSPISFIDFDGRDRVWYNCEGVEVKREKSATLFNVYVQTGVSYKYSKSGTQLKATWTEAPMPKILQVHSDYNGNEVKVSDAKYQANDYIIAAETKLFNIKKSRNDEVPTTGGKSLKNASGQVPDLDPTMVKAVIMQESNMGTYDASPRDNNDSKKDIMQSNVFYSPTSHDWNSDKAQFGLIKGGVTLPQQSIKAGIGLLYLKGLRDPKTGYTQTQTWNGGANWENAIRDYNGKSAARPGHNLPQKEEYKNEVIKMANESKTPTPNDY